MVDRKMRARQLPYKHFFVLAVLAAAVSSCATGGTASIRSVEPQTRPQSSALWRRAAARGGEPDADLRAVRKEWELDASAPSLPAAQVTARPAVSGLWVTGAREGGASVALTRRGDGLYELELWTGGCLGQWHTNRLARYEGGVLTLNYPVRQYPGKVFQTLFSVSVGGGDYLLPDADVPDYLRYQHGTDSVRTLDWYAGGYLLHLVPQD
jgi:hypothetical protein